MRKVVKFAYLFLVIAVCTFSVLVRVQTERYIVSVDINFNLYFIPNNQTKKEYVDEVISLITNLVRQQCYIKKTMVVNWSGFYLVIRIWVGSIPAFIHIVTMKYTVMVDSIELVITIKRDDAIISFREDEGYTILKTLVYNYMNASSVTRLSFRVL